MKTVGEASRDLLIKGHEPVPVIDQQREMQKDYLDNLIECVQTNKRKIEGDFFVVVITKQEPLMPNVFRNYFGARSTCPTPDYDQTVFKYDRSREHIEYIWTIPSRDACIHLKDNALQVDKSECELLKFVLDFADGTLYNLCRKLNHEDSKKGIDD